MSTETIIETKPKAVYVAGPMTGYPEFNFPAFFAAQKKLEAQGWKVWNPADKDSEANLDPEAVKTGNDKLAMEKGFDFRDAFGWECDKVVNGDGIYMLKGWEASPGARAEHAIASVMKIKYPEYKIMYQDAEGTGI
jgi:hypothetical protein